MVRSSQTYAGRLRGSHGDVLNSSPFNDLKKYHWKRSLPEIGRKTTRNSKRWYNFLLTGAIYHELSVHASYSLILVSSRWTALLLKRRAGVENSRSAVSLLWDGQSQSTTSPGLIEAFRPTPPSVSCRSSGGQGALMSSNSAAIMSPDPA